MDWKTLVGFTIIFHGIVYAWKRSWILRLDTKRLNRCINGLSQHRIRKYLRIWFRMGTYVTILIGFPFTLWLFLRTLYYALAPSIATVAQAVTPSSIMSPSEPVLELHYEQLSPYPDADMPISAPASSASYLAIQPILPGWNLPLSHLPYYLLAILISVVIHELGHAIASASHRIPILSMGVSLFGPLIPAAHVELNSAQLRDTPFKKQLDILTAGVWMNMYLAVVTFFVVPRLLPAILFPTHSLGSGLAVTGVISSSGAGGPGGLERGDIIIGVENCPVYGLDSWLTCLETIWEADPIGVCLTSNTVTMFSNSSDNPGCCGPDDNSPTHLCFMQKTPFPLPSSNPNGTLVSVQPLDQSLNSSINSSTSSQSSFCLPAKPVMTLNETTSPKCHSPNYACDSPGDQLQKLNTEPQDETEDMKVKREAETSHCYLARILKQYDGFRIIQIHRKQQQRKSSVLFVGDVWDLRNGVHTTDYVARDWWLSRLFTFGKFSIIPVHLETILLLTAGLSAGLAVVNMLPIYGLDGYHVVDAIIRVSVGKTWEARKISRLVNYISWTAVMVALLTVLCSIVQSF